MKSITSFEIQNLMTTVNLTDWEKGFLQSINHQLLKRRNLSSRQINKIDEIKSKAKTKTKTKNIEVKSIEISHQRNINYIPDNIINRLDEILERYEYYSYNIYLYGSQMYGNQNINSDYDFLVVFNDMIYTPEQYLSDEIDITYKNKSEVIQSISEGNINYIENIQGLIKESFDLKVNLKLNSSFIRNAMRQADKSYYKGLRLSQSSFSSKRYKGKKSFFHSLRIVLNAKNILESGEIDFDKINKLYKKVKDYSLDELKRELSNLKKSL